MTLQEAFLAYCTERPSAVAVSRPFRPETERLSRDSLLRAASSAARHLRTLGMRQGNRVLLSLGTDATFLKWYWAAQLLGIVVVPVEPAVSRRRKAAQTEYIRLLGGAVRAGAIILCRETTLDPNDLPNILCIPEDAADSDRAVLRREEIASVTPQDVALIQFSSGSTGQPKGCVLTHSAIAANARAWIAKFGYRCGEATLNWMPLFHDFGLMLGVLAPVFGNMTSILLPTRSFIADPATWLRALTVAGPVHTAAPASVLSLVCTRLESRHWQDLALHEIRSLICAAEPIDPGAARRFIDLAAGYGFEPDAFFCGYGMSETTAMASAKRGLTLDYLPRDFSSSIGAQLDAPQAMQATRAFVSLGLPHPGSEFQVVDDRGVRLGERRLGHLRIRSDSLLECYVDARGNRLEAMKDGWLETGDIGYLAHDEFHFVARHKELIVAAGRKIAPADVDHAISTALGIGVHRVASFGQEDGSDASGIIVIVECRHADWLSIERIARTACYEQTGFQPAAIVTCPIGTIPKTSSGKIRRTLLQERFQRGQLSRGLHGACA